MSWTSAARRRGGAAARSIAAALCGLAGAVAAAPSIDIDPPRVLAAAAERIAARLAAARHPRTVRLELVDTGHQVLGTGWAPTTAFNRPTGGLQGGDPALDARAQATLWRKLLEFLGEELR